MHSLPLFVRLASRKVVIVGEGEAAAAKARLVERAGGTVVGESDAANAAVAFVALDDEHEARAAVDRLKRKRLLVNAVDRPDLCDFTTPAVVDRAPVLIAISTGGASAGLAKALRQRIEKLLPSKLGKLALALSDARNAIRQRWSDPADRRRALDAALAPDGPLDPLADREANADARLKAWLDGKQELEKGREEKVRLSSDDPDELTLRAARLLGEADHVLHEPQCPPAILARARADAIRHCGPAEPDALEGLVVRLIGPEPRRKDDREAQDLTKFR